jgi:RimJ/RimL family protein N-acetyltransferase
LLRVGFEHLSDRSRYFRFLRAVPRLSERDLRELSHPDHDGHEAIGAVDIGADPPEPAGIARYLRLPDRPERAELAVTVVDAYQGRGLGTLLFALLTRIAAAHGIAGFVALIHAENSGMRDLLLDLGAERTAVHGTEREYLMPVHADPARYPDSAAGRAFRAAWPLAADA